MNHYSSLEKLCRIIKITKSVHKYSTKFIYRIGSWDQHYVTFQSHILSIFIICQSVCPWVAFLAQSQSTQSSMARVYMSEAIFRCSTLCQRLLASPTNIRLGWKGLPGTKHQLITNLHKFINYGHKIFIAFLPGTNLVKLFWHKFTHTFLVSQTIL